MQKTRYIFVTGGVTSSLGKGIISASLAKLLQARGYSVTIQKLDPYINVDPGTLNPYEHGECYVTVDGAETDLDLGHYERFLGVPTTQSNNITTGRIYQNVIDQERHGDFLGKTVQIIPHITNEIKRNIMLLGETEDYDFVITEIGGTVGDIESLPYVETVRQLKWELGSKALVIHLTYVPYLASSGELKTKPTQHSVKKLQEEGVQPDILVLRTEHELGEDIRNKVGRFCNVDRESVIQSIDVDTIYEVPLKMQEEGLDKVVLKKMKVIKHSLPEMSQWNDFLKRLKSANEEVHIGLVGKYVELADAYKSIIESLIHAAAYNDRKLDLHLIQAENIIEENVAKQLSGMQGVIVAPGFGDRGIEGKITAVKYVRENNIPFLGICLGMQCAVIEFARNVIGLEGANTSENESTTTPYPVIDIMDEQKNVSDMGGTMRLGAYDCELVEGSKVYSIYGKKKISERHRHRYEFNDQYKQQFIDKGMIPVGFAPQSGLVDVVEIPTHPWFVGVQYHPEYSSTVVNPHPLFRAFVKAAIENSNH